MTTHTPGPWRVNGPWHIQAPSTFTGRRANGEPIPDGTNVIAQITPRSDLDEREANARLIAAAPEMLAAIRGLMKQLEYADVTGTADQAIACALLARIETK